MSFLTAEWRRLAFANYSIDPKILAPYVPFKTELDTWNGTTYISLVGFLFQNVRIKGVKFPFHVNFEEINLRFYVKYFDGKIWKRGVVFIKETVPKPAITLVANTLYKEHYETSKMTYDWSDTKTLLQTSYALKKAGRWHTFNVTSDAKGELTKDDTEEQFITEHYWGYSQQGKNKTVEYQVTHPSWELYNVTDYRIDVDFGKVHGADFSILNTMKPTTVFLAEGSTITIESKRTIK